MVYKKKVGRKKNVGLSAGKIKDTEKSIARRKKKLADMIDTYFLGTVDENGNVKFPTIKELCHNSGYSIQMFYYYIRNDAYLREKYEAMREIRIDSQKNIAENNITEALEGKGRFSDMEGKEVARLSLDFLKQTDKLYNPKVNVDVTSKNLDLSMSMEDLYAQFEQFKNM